MAESHKLSLLLGADRRLARDVAGAALAPLAGETELSRERLGSTLDAWLRHRGRTEAVAKALHVHPQTVRYRLARLRELFGDRLDDPDGRFELELALRARESPGRLARRMAGPARWPRGGRDRRLLRDRGGDRAGAVGRRSRSVALGARRADRLEALAESLDGRALVHEVDVSDEEQARGFVAGRHASWAGSTSS